MTTVIATGTVCCMADQQKIGERLDQLGVTQELDDGDLIASAVVITKVIDTEGRVSVGIAGDEACTWLDQLGLVTAAAQVLDGGAERRFDE